MPDLELITFDAEELYTNAIQKMEIAAGEPLYPGDERRVFAEALIEVLVGMANKCNIACNSKFLDNAEGDALDALGARSNTIRIAAAPAVATFEFTLSAAVLTDTVIPAGTMITTDGDVNFATNEDLTIAAGDTKGTVIATCTVAGEEGNGYIAGSVAQLVDSITNVESAINTETTSGGSDEEDDDTYRERIRIAPSSFSTAGPEKAYIYWAKSASATIQDVVVDIPSVCTVNLYILCKGGQLPNAALLALVEASCSASDRRPITDYVTALAPTTVTYNIEITYYTTAEDEEACEETIEGEGGAIDQYIAWQSGAIGRDINPDKLRALCLSPESGTGCIRIDVTSPARAEVDPLKVGIIGTTSVTKEVVEE